MKRIVVEAFEDPSRPSGGHAVILLREVAAMPDRPSIRLRPVETEFGGDRSGLWRGGRLQPIATRATVSGTELVIGPDVVGNPHLVAGTPVIIEIVEADVRGEFLWPSVAPLALPRRRRVIVPRTGGNTLPMPAPANDARSDSVVADADESDAATAKAAELASAEAPAAAATAGPAAPDATAVLQAIADAAAAVAPLETAAAGTPAAAADTQHDTAPARAPREDAKAEPARSIPAGGVAWTPDAMQKRAHREKVLRYGVAAAALLALFGIWKARHSVDPDMQLSEKYARPPAIASKAEAAAPSPAKPAAATAGAEGARDGTTTAAAAGPAAIAAKPIASACGTPEIKTEPMAAGRMRVSVNGKCAVRQSVHFRYGGADQAVRLDGNGAAVFVLDAFAGDTEPLQLEFNDGRRDSVPVAANDLDRVSKVAVIWKAPVDLDLHAFEYAALPGGRGHVWSGAAGSLDDALRAISADKRGHGFLSSAATASANGDHVEVYSFLHSDEQTAGSVGLALDYATRGETPDGETCGPGALAEIPYDLVMRPRGGTARRESGIIAAAPCGATLGAGIRYRQATLPALKIKK